MQEAAEMLEEEDALHEQPGVTIQDVQRDIDKAMNAQGITEPAQGGDEPG